MKPLTVIDEAVRLRVLIIEDSEDDALLLVRHLRQGGYEPVQLRVDTPHDTQVALRDYEWDLVITDHNMPNYNSSDALALIAATGLDLPVIVVSGSIGEEIAVDTMKAGAHDYVMKGHLARLVPAIERELREAEGRRAHRRAEETIRHMAFHDALTGLINRTEFELRVRRALESARNYGTSHALLFIDLDQFKIVNDTSGHLAGDEMLKRLTRLLLTKVRGSDTLARLGGDEFGVLLEKCNVDQANQIAEHLLRAVQGFRFSWNERAFTIGASIGMAMITSASPDIGELLSAADIACYAAKDRGRNRIHLYSANDAELSRRQTEMQWVSRIHEALAHDRFVLYQQPIVSLAEPPGHAHYEFLVRIRDAKGEIIPPGAFIPAAERYNLMSKVDRKVIDKAFHYVSKRLAAANGNPTGTAFINISATSLSDSAFLPFVQEKIAAFQLPPGSICFEITETAAITDLDNAQRFIHDIKKLGCLFALDDFGTGTCSFSYLKSIQADFLKIDGHFVTHILEDDVDCAIVEAVNRIGHVAGIRTIAEFVETDALRARLAEMGVNYGQGYGIQRPMPID